jgi:hypothetical protein
MMDVPKHEQAIGITHEENAAFKIFLTGIQ